MPSKDKERNRIYQRTWYKKNRQLQITRNRENKKKKYVWFKKYKQTLKCKMCGESHIAALDFHHRDPITKEIGIQQILYRNFSIENIKKEIDKCDVLCSNCHRKLHYEQRLKEKINRLCPTRGIHPS